MLDMQGVSMPERPELDYFQHGLAKKCPDLKSNSHVAGRGDAGCEPDTEFIAVKVLQLISHIPSPLNHK
jgi:hypothetical protein